MIRLSNQSPVEQLQAKIARYARWRERERYFALRIVPVLLAWALCGEGYLLSLREDPVG